MNSTASVKYAGHVRKVAKNFQMSGTVLRKNVLLCSSLLGFLRLEDFEPKLQQTAWLALTYFWQRNASHHPVIKVLSVFSWLCLFLSTHPSWCGRTIKYDNVSVEYALL